jgi:DNA-binding GntR family transcriptional regulator
VTLARLEPVSTTSSVLRAIRDAIIAGELPQGEQLRELQLAAQLGTGRGAVREALRQLVQEGLIEHRLHRGVFVRVFSAEDVLDVYRAREAVETAAVAAACAGEAELDVRPLEECLEQMRAAAGWHDQVAADVAFHERLVALARSRRLDRMYATLAAETRMHLHQYPPYSTARNVEDHAEILAAVRDGSPRAVDLVREHLRYSAALAAEWKEAPRWGS